MIDYRDWRAVPEEWLALDELTTEEFQGRDISINLAWEDFAAVDEQVRDLAESEQVTGFRELWPLLVQQKELGDEEDRTRWEVRCLAELSWFLLRGSGTGFRVWDADKLREHLRRLKALALPVREHEAEGVAFVREALYWTGENLARWERLIEATGSKSSMEALNVAVTALVRSRCSGWPEVEIDGKLFGFFSLTSPEGGGVMIDLADDFNGRTMCKICWDCGPDWSGIAGEMLDYSDPDFLAKFRENLRAAGLDPRPPEWPLS
ncbi:MAG: hypothetical protein N2112_04710 [Gemmataceae bacterium]|jgi:glycosyltransferase involved in cell wall biosynthesis|nr:hypothetical protein [Gemmataceae bacterium]